MAERRGRGGLIARVVGVLAVAGFIGLLIYGVAAQAPDTTIDDGLARGRATAAPDFQHDVLQRGRVPTALRPTIGRAAADDRIALRELHGTPVVLNFWASWCDPCRVEAPVLERGWKAMGGEGVLFLGLDMQDVSEDAREFLRELRVTYPNMHEAGKDTSRRYGLTGLPETYFISPRGEVVGHVIGAIDDAQLRDGVSAARSGQPRPLGRGGESRPTQ